GDDRGPGEGQRGQCRVPRWWYPTAPPQRGQYAAREDLNNDAWLAFGGYAGAQRGQYAAREDLNIFTTDWDVVGAQAARAVRRPRGSQHLHDRLGRGRRAGSAGSTPPARISTSSRPAGPWAAGGQRGQ